MFENVTFTRVAAFASGAAGDPSGTTVVPLWVQGVVYNGTVAQPAAQRLLKPTRSVPMGGRPRPTFPDANFSNVRGRGRRRGRHALW